MEYLSCTMIQWHHLSRPITYSRWSHSPWWNMISIWEAGSKSVQWIMESSSGRYRPVNTYMRQYATSKPNGRRRNLDGNCRDKLPHPSLRITSPNWKYKKNWIQRKPSITNHLLVSYVRWSNLAGSIWSPKFPLYIPSFQVQGVDNLRLYSTYLHTWTVSITSG